MNDLPEGYKKTVIDKKLHNRLYKSLSESAGRFLGICELFRFMYDVVFELKDKRSKEALTEMLIDGLEMGKKMRKRLLYYKTKYNDTSGHGGRNMIRLIGTGERKKRRMQRL